jgi:hypothetical protein
MTSAPRPRINLVALLFILWGAMTMVIGASTLALAIAAAALTRRSGNGQLAAGVLVATFATLAVLALAWGGAHLAIGTRLRRLRPWSRMAALVLGSVDLMLLPYGTAVGVFSLWTLLREDAKQLFEAGT